MRLDNIMKRLLVALIAISIMASPVAAQDQQQEDGAPFDLSGFGEFVSGIAQSGGDVSGQVLSSLSETLNVGNAASALSQAANQSVQNVQSISQGQFGDIQSVPDRPDDTPTR